MAENIINGPAADYIVPLNINHLEGRMLRAPGAPGTKREILLVYGHHALLERWWGLVENLVEYGNVTMPDLPGFGGMDSFAKIGIYPSLDAYADYLAAFIKLRFKRKKITIIGISWGFPVVTRMLQKYPELVDKVSLLISMVGFMHYQDFLYSPPKRFFYRWSTRFFATRPVSFFIRYCCLNHFVISHIYVRLPMPKRRMIEVTPEYFRGVVEFEVKIWQSNDVRTHWFTTSHFFILDNCKVKVNLPVVHVVSKGDHYFNNEYVKQHMLVTFSKYTRFSFDSKAHTPFVTADKNAMAIMIPPGLRRILRTNP